MVYSAVVGTLTGCIGCMVSIEALSRENKGCMNLMTFATFLFISLQGVIFQARFFTQRKHIPFRCYLSIILLFFFVNVANNQALNFDVSVPLLIIFRSGSLMANLLLGVLLKRWRYPIRKYVSVIVITIGIIICTLATPSSQKASVTLLSLALFVSAYLGLCQEDIYRNHGKHPQELMLYVHLLSLPAFLLLWGDISAAAAEFSASPSLTVFDHDTHLPRLWCRLFLTCLLQWLCISRVYLLTSQLSSLNVTLVITLRKFVSVILSIYLFDNPFTGVHIIGTVLVFGGTLAFYDNWDRVLLPATTTTTAVKVKAE